jgi:hypothetical protein
MNERIRQLAEQAKKYSLDAMIKITDKEQALKVYSETYDTKFALLLMREIAMVQITHQASMDLENKKMDDPAKELNYAVIEHFGVEKQVQDSKELHTCPYREEIHNDYESLCDCDEEQQHQCAMDI